MSRAERAPETPRALPHRLDPRAGRPGGPAGPTRRLTWTGRVLAGVVSSVVLVTSGWGWYLTEVADATVSRTDAIPSSGNDETVRTGAAMNLLLVGSDSRADLTAQQLAEFKAGADSGTNTDTMILAHVPADGSKASFVSFPRDSWVDIPGHGGTS